MPGPDYLDFDIVFEALQPGYRAYVAMSPVGQATATFEEPVSEGDFGAFLDAFAHPRRTTRGMNSPERDQARLFGRRLFETVFAGKVGVCLIRSLDEAERQGKGLRLRLHLERAPALINLPWEYAYHADVDRFLALSDKTPIVRYLAVPETVRPLKVVPPLQILVAISSPRDYPSLDIDREVGKLNEALGELERHGLIAIDCLQHATLDALDQKLRRKPYHVLHFVGHGQFVEATRDGVLVLETETGHGRLVSGRDLGIMLLDHRSMRLAVLNACEGARSSTVDVYAGTAQALLQQRVPAVIAMQYEITDEAAISFAREFYGAVANGYPLEGAVSAARRRLFWDSLGCEWATPVLYLRSPSGQVFDIGPLTDRHSALLDATAKTPIPPAEVVSAPGTPRRPPEESASATVETTSTVPTRVTGQPRKTAAATYGIAILCHLIGFGLVALDSGRARGWLYPLIPLFMLGVSLLGLIPAKELPVTPETRDMLLRVAAVAYLASLFDVLMMASLSVRGWLVRRPVAIFPGLAIAAPLSGFAFAFTPGFSLNLTVVAPILVVVAAYRLGPWHATGLAALSASFWTIVAYVLAYQAEGELPTRWLLDGVTMGPLTFPHSGLPGLIRLTALGLLTAWLVRSGRSVLEEMEGSIASHAMSASTTDELRPRTIVWAVAAILLCNTVLLLWLWGPRTTTIVTVPLANLGLIATAVVAAKHGPRVGAVAGMLAAMAAFALNPWLPGLGRLNVRGVRFFFDNRELGHALSFAMVGLWSGFLTKRLGSVGAVTAWLQNTMPVRRPSVNATGPVLPFVLPLVVGSIIVTLVQSGEFSASLVLWPLQAAGAILAGHYLSSERASRVVGVTLVAVAVGGLLLQLLGWQLVFAMGPTSLKVGVVAGSMTSIAVLIAAAWVSGRIDLAGHAQRGLWLAVAMVGVIEMFEVLRSGRFPSSYLSVSIDRVWGVDLLTALMWVILQPLVIAGLVRVTMRYSTSAVISRPN
jgi:hypothetical protein